jgi:hypothetical protein
VHLGRKNSLPIQVLEIGLKSRMCEMLPQIALKSRVFFAKTLKNQGSNKYFEVSKSTLNR